MGATQLIKLGNFLFGSLWGLNLVDLLQHKDFPIIGIDQTIQTVMAIVGAIYFILMAFITIPHKIKMNKLDRELKEEDLKSKKKENKPKKK